MYVCVWSSTSFPILIFDTISFCNSEEKFLLGIKDAAAIVSLLIVIVVLIAKLRECIRNPSCGGRMFVGSNLITGSDIGSSSIQLPNIDVNLQP